MTGEYLNYTVVPFTSLIQVIDIYIHAKYQKMSLLSKHVKVQLVNFFTRRKSIKDEIKHEAIKIANIEGFAAKAQLQ